MILYYKTQKFKYLHSHNKFLWMKEIDNLYNSDYKVIYKYDYEESKECWMLTSSIYLNLTTNQVLL